MKNSESQTAPPPELITEGPRLERLCNSVAAQGWFAFDTEFVGEDSFRPLVCLMQVATKDVCAIIDPIAQIDVRPLWELVADPTIRVIVHAGSEDLALCHQEIGRPAASVVDLQIAAGFVGLGYPISLSHLARATIGARIHKSQTLTDWRRRPLTAEQIHYAAEDVVHLPAIHEFIVQRLEKLGRKGWAEVACAALCTATSAEPTAEKRIRRLRGAGVLRPREQVIAEAILDVRDQLAKEYDRPTRAVLKDYLVAEMARHGWTDPKRLATLRGVNLSLTAMRQIAKAIEAASQAPLPAPSEPGSEPDTPEEEILISLLTAILKDWCRHHQLAFGLLATRRDIRELVLALTRTAPGLPPVMRTGWRSDAVGSIINRVLAGAAIRLIRDQNGFRVNIDDDSEQ